MDLDNNVEEVNAAVINVINNPFLNKNLKINFQYDRVLILSSIDNININEKQNFTKEEFKLLCKSFYLIEADTELLKISHHYNNAYVLDYDILSYIETNIDIKEKEIVITLWGIKKNILEVYLQQFTPKNKLLDYFVMSEVNKYYENNRGICCFNRCNYLKSIKESNYWSLLENCKHNITINFMNRNFSNEFKNIKDLELKKQIEQITNNDNDYLLHMKRDQLYTDISKSLQMKGNYYKLKDYSNLDISKNNIISILKNIKSEKELYYFVASILISKDYSHLIINNSDAMQILVSEKWFYNKFNKKNNFLKKYINMFKYCIGYIWISYYMEESIKKTYINEDDRFVFDINTAKYLPYFPFESLNPKTSPYFSLLVDDKILDIPNNNLTFGCVANNLGEKSRLKGIECLKVFQLKLNLFITNDMNLHLLENVDWTKFAITGSVMPACIQTYNPLTSYFQEKGKYKNSNNIFTDFIDEYYKNSDLDIMCNNSSTIEFIKDSFKLYEQLNTNINKVYKDENLKLKLIKQITIYISPDYINDKLVSENKNYDYIINYFASDNDVLQIIYNDYLEYHFNYICKYVNDDIFQDNNFNDFFEPLNIASLKIYLSNDRVENNNEGKNIYFYENIKFKIFKNKILKRDIEIFKIKYNNYFSIVSKFHLPCVRAYYTNNNVYMLPSFITAMMTNYNIDYKYFAGTSSPYTIINKYRYRGFSTILNDSEKIDNINYLVDFTNNRHKIKISNIYSIKKIYGLKYINNLNFYKLSDKYYNVDKNLYSIINKDQVKKEYQKYYDSPMYHSNINQINKEGFINPLKKYIIDDIYQKSFNL